MKKLAGAISIGDNLIWGRGHRGAFEHITPISFDTLDAENETFTWLLRVPYSMEDVRRVVIVLIRRDQSSLNRNRSVSELYAEARRLLTREMMRGTNDWQARLL